MIYDSLVFHPCFLTSLFSASCLVWYQKDVFPLLLIHPFGMHASPSLWEGETNAPRK